MASGFGLQVTQYIGALGKPCTSITIDRKYYLYYT